MKEKLLKASKRVMDITKVEVKEEQLSISNLIPSLNFYYHIKELYS